MKALERFVLAGTIIILGVFTFTGCQQQAVEPRIDTSNQQLFTESLSQVRSQVDKESIEQFDRAVDYAQHTYYLQKQYSLLPVSNPLHGLSAEEVLKLQSENHKYPQRRLSTWTSI